ncbi:hypothetical protein J2S10_004400 [Neobacillus ginsengisoli]|uniref:Uncharacterized protein n=1 Tax=Neobacillus ginsengisoli TaxID=904295 RepID=A0ABT9Y218_9BACI|nr:hypothetical protein [Neobacillus ginsengisoli]
MSVNHEELKRMIDQISEQDVLEVYDWIFKHETGKINSASDGC